MKRENKKKAERWVIKAGSNMVCTGGPLLLRDWMNQVSLLKSRHNVEVIWVTSGAIVSAVERTRFKHRNRKLVEKQALSAIGQPLIMDLYNLALQSSGRLGAQILLSYEDLANKKRLSNFQQTIEKLLEWGVVPILNENDVVATEEIKFGDNDALSAQVAYANRAHRLVILTDVEGLYDSDPRKNRNAALVTTVNRVTPKLLAQTTPQAGTERGTGGMYSKLKAARYASDRGIQTRLVKGDTPHVLLKIAAGESVGTLIPASKDRA